MSSDHFVKVFDILQSGYRSWPFAAFGLIFVAIGLLIVCLPFAIKWSGLSFIAFDSRRWKFRRYGMLGFAVLWTGIAFYATYSPYLRHKALAQENRCSLVEGQVPHFVGGPKSDSFYVSGVPFSYANSVVTDGFNDTVANGGPLTGDSFVRICYDPSDHAILRLEIQGFVGEPKDYAAPANWFSVPMAPTRDRRPGPPAVVIWCASLAFLVFASDVIAIQLLLSPYLRMFFRIKTTIVRDIPIPSTLAPGQNTPLNNSTIRWDREHHVIWLRPRGLNVFQVPFAVAALDVDESGSFIRGYRVRFSIGVPVGIVLMLWAQYRGISADVAQVANVPWLLMIAGIIILMLAFFLAATWRMVRSRMETLVRDGLADIAKRAGPWARLAEAR